MTLTTTEHIRDYGDDFSFEYSWSPKPGWHRHIVGGPFPSRGMCRAEAIKALRECGYTRPRWWQYWRWGEYVPEGF